MDAYKAVIGKRDRRDFDASRPLSDEALGRILQAGRMAGSSSNSQPIRLIVIRDQKTREALVPLGRGTAQLVQAPVAVAVLLKKGARDFDVGRTVQNMMVAAWSEGIISCPVGIQQREPAQAILGYPEDYELSICSTFGYPAPAEPSGEPRESRPRLPIDELVHWEKW